jgi:hypothetical protein
MLLRRFVMQIYSYALASYQEDWGLRLQLLLSISLYFHLCYPGRVRQQVYMSDACFVTRS